jgi:hypothetical protein
MKGQFGQSCLRLCLLGVIAVAITSCGDNGQAPIAIDTPTPASTLAVSPTPSTPVATTQPTLKPTPATLPSPVRAKLKPTPVVLPTTPNISALPKSLYPQPTPVTIVVPSAPVNTKANSKTDPIAKLKLPTDPTMQITPVGIGVAKIGMSLKELKEQTGEGFEFPIKTSLLEGFDAIAVTKAGKVQFYIPYPAGTQFTDTDRIQHLITDNPAYRTQQGVGPGTSIGQATTVYGSATLSLSKDSESREFINFTQHPDGLAFRPKPFGTHAFAGEYPESNDDYLKTQKYDNRAAIDQITVSCTVDQCEEPK